MAVISLRNILFNINESKFLKYFFFYSLFITNGDIVKLTQNIFVTQDYIVFCITQD